jgi:dsRNA-specific ribonuclease
MSLAKIRAKHPPPTPKDFKSDKFFEFIKSILLRGFLQEEWIEGFLKGRKRQLGFLDAFKVAMTHCSVSSSIQENSEGYELLGDVVVNAAFPWYIRDRHPEIVNIEWQAKIKHVLQGKLPLAKMAVKLGFENWVLIDESRMEIFNSIEEDLHDLSEYMSIYEDAFEAFFGCFVDSAEKYGVPWGVALEVSKNIIFDILDESNIDLSFDMVFDSVSQFDKIASSLGWPKKAPNGKTDFLVTQIFDRAVLPPTYTFLFYGWPRDGPFVEETRELLARSVTSVDASKAKQDGAQKALRNLRSHGFKVHEISKFDVKTTCKGFFTGKKILGNLPKTEEGYAVRQLLHDRGAPEPPKEVPGPRGDYRGPSRPPPYVERRFPRSEQDTRNQGSEGYRSSYRPSAGSDRGRWGWRGGRPRYNDGHGRQVDID